MEAPGGPPAGQRRTQSPPLASLDPPFATSRNGLHRMKPQVRGVSILWQVQDSNLRRIPPTDLHSEHYEPLTSRHSRANATSAADSAQTLRHSRPSPGPTGPRLTCTSDSANTPATARGARLSAGWRPPRPSRSIKTQRIAYRQPDAMGLTRGQSNQRLSSTPSAHCPVRRCDDHPRPSRCSLGQHRRLSRTASSLGGSVVG